MRRRLRSPLLLVGYFSVFLFLVILLFLWSIQSLPLNDTPPSSLVSTSVSSGSSIPSLSHNPYVDPRNSIDKRNDADEFYIPESESFLSVEDIFDYYGIPSSDGSNRSANKDYGNKNKDSFPSKNNAPSDLHSHFSELDYRMQTGGPCRMETCFNHERCQITGSLKVYVYPLDKFVPISGTYEKILNRIMNSHYYTNDPDEACLFVLSIDTLDRDELSPDYVRNVAARLKKLPVRNLKFMLENMINFVSKLSFAKHFLYKLIFHHSTGITEKII